MAHNIWGERFFSRKPAWHEVGHVSDEDVTATDALIRYLGSYKVTLERAEAMGWRFAEKLIIRHPTETDPHPRVFGLVSFDYNLIDPATACGIWDKHVGRPVETIGALAEGSTLFITTKLPTIDVHGDEVEMYLLCSSPMTGKEAAIAAVTPVRVVCQNTLRTAKALSTTTMKVRHDDGAAERLGQWMGDLYKDATDKVDAMHEVFELLAECRPSGEIVTAVLTAAYPAPAPLAENAPREVLAERQAQRQQRVAMMTSYQAAARDLFNGGAVGNDAPAMTGTLWGLYNAVAELENYRRANGKDDSAAASVLWGARGDAIERAFVVCAEVARSR
jgi:hypothetical protein